MIDREELRRLLKCVKDEPGHFSAEDRLTRAARESLPDLLDALERADVESRTTRTLLKMKETGNYEDAELIMGSEDRSWMTREDLESHYESAMLNWNAALTERDRAEAESARLREALACAVPRLEFLARLYQQPEEKRLLDVARAALKGSPR